MRKFAGLWVALIALGCGDNVSGGDPITPITPIDAGSSTDAAQLTPPTGAFVFPVRPALTDRDALRVRGVAADDVAVAAVRVNGHAAVSTDGFANWYVDIPLDVGPNVLSVEVEDTDGAVTSDADSVKVTRSEVTGRNATDLAVDMVSQRAYVADAFLDVIVSVDLSTGIHRVLSGDGAGTGMDFENPIAVELDAAQGRLLVLDDNLDALLAVDLTTGARTVLSGSQDPGPPLGGPSDLVLDAGNGRALVLDDDLNALLAVELATGARSILADGNNGNGENLEAPTGLTLDSPAGRVLVVDRELDALLSIDLTTGDRTVLSDNTSGGGRLSSPSAVGLATSGDTAWILDGDRLYEVDLTTGDRAYLSTGLIGWSDTYHGHGILYVAPKAMVVDASQDMAWVLDNGHRMILTTDLVTGRRSIPWGSHATRPGTLVIDDQQRYAYAVDGWLKGTVRIDLETSEQTLIADHDLGSGETPVKPRDAVFNPVTQQPIYVDAVDWDDDDWYSAAVAIDPITGDRTLIAGSTFAPHVGTGPVLYDLPAVILDQANQRLITLTQSSWDYCDRRALMTIDLNTLDRALLAGHDDCGFSQGTGPMFRWLSGMVLHPDQTHAYVTDVVSDALLLVDLTTGDRTVISDAATGAGPLFERPARLTLDSGGTRAIVLEAERDELIAVDLATGDRTILVTDTAPERGPPLWNATGIVSDVVPGVVLVSVEGPGLGIAGGVLMVDLETGYRAAVWH